MYGLEKYEKLGQREADAINFETRQDYFSSESKVDLDQDGFKIAFGVMDYLTKQPFRDSNYVRFNVFLETRKNLEIMSQIELGYHVCNDHDFSSFYKFDDKDVAMKDELLTNQVMYCLDDGQDVFLRGEDEIDSVALNIDFTTCDRTKGGQCARNSLTDLQNYLSHPELVIIYNSQKFDKGILDEPNPLSLLDPRDHHHGKEAIVSEAVVWNRHINKMQANYMEVYYETRHLNEDGFWWYALQDY